MGCLSRMRPSGASSVNDTATGQDIKAKRLNEAEMRHKDTKGRRGKEGEKWEWDSDGRKLGWRRNREVSSRWWWAMSSQPVPA